MRLFHEGNAEILAPSAKRFNFRKAFSRSREGFVPGIPVRVASMCDLKALDSLREQSDKLEGGLPSDSRVDTQTNLSANVFQRSNGFPFGDGGYGVQPTRRLNQPRVELRGATGSRWFLGVPHASVGEGLTQPMDRSPLPRTGPWRLRHPLESPLTGRRTGRRPASIPMDAGAGPDAPAWARAGSWSEPLMVLGCGIGQRSRIDGGPSAARRGLRFQSLAGEVGGPFRRHISFKSMIYCVLRIP
jgi:hypothetical protein